MWFKFLHLNFRLFKTDVYKMLPNPVDFSFEAFCQNCNIYLTLEYFEIGIFQVGNDLNL